MTYNGMLPFFPANLLQIPHEERHHQPTKPQDFRGMEAVLGKRPMSFTGIEACEVLNMADEVSDNGLQPAGEKKKRLNLEQIRTLEKNFDMGSKLEPERKMELARTLGLHPRQITIWFQNRRARWKTKQLEKDYDELKKQFEIIKAENDALLAQNKNLLSELLALKGKETSEPIINLNKETVGSCSIRSESSSDVNLDISRASINDSCSDPHHSRTFFPSYRTPGVPQLIHRSSSETHKADNSIQEGNFCNVYCSTDEQSAFWAWSEQHNFHH